MINNYNFDEAVKYVQGSIWLWVNGNEKKEGVQCGDRPVLIISNNTFNRHSPSVNCVSITSIIKPSPAHVSLFISKDSQIQCEQVHTISKSDLVEYKGTVPGKILHEVKMKLKMQFDIPADNHTKLLLNMKESIESLKGKSHEPSLLPKILAEIGTMNNKIEAGFNKPSLEETFFELLLELESSFKKVVSEVEILKSKLEQSPHTSDEQPGAETSNHVTGSSGFNDVKTVESGTLKNADEINSKRNRYTKEDYLFMADESNSYDAIMEKYGLDIKGAYRVRNFSKKWIERNNEHIPKTTEDNGSKKQTHRAYSEEDIKFILNENNTVDDLVKRFEYKDKYAAYSARGYVRRKYAG